MGVGRNLGIWALRLVVFPWTVDWFGREQMPDQ